MTESERAETEPKPDLVLEQWQFERECRLRELALKEREQANKDAELDLQRREQQAATWRSPLIVAIFAAAVAGAGNALVTLVNGSLQRELEGTKREAELTLERSKAESSRILEMIKTGNNDLAADNLDFLLKAGLVTDARIGARLSEYLNTRPAGTGPSLPSANPRVGVEETTTIDRSAQAVLQDRLNKYLKFLDEVGFPPSPQKVMIRVEPSKIDNAYYDGSKIVIDQRFVDDPSVALREYTHHVLNVGHSDLAWQGQYGALESGAADYFACSFLGNPKVGERAATVLKIGKGYFRNLDNARGFVDLTTLRDPQITYEGAEVWGGLFWELRSRLGASVADRLIAAAWKGLPSIKGAMKAEDFLRPFVAESKKLGATQSTAVTEILRKRGFPLPV